MVAVFCAYFTNVKVHGAFMCTYVLSNFQYLTQYLPFKFQNFFQSEHQGFGLGHLQYSEAVKDPDEVPEAGHHGGEGSVALFPPHHQVPARR